MWSIITGILGTIATPVTDWLKGRQELKKIEVENKAKLQVAKTEAMISQMQTQQSADIAWEKISIDNSGWKDEFWTLVLAIPAVLCFIPGMDGYVRAGFDALGGVPEWYQWSLGIAIGSAFGVRKFADLMNWKKGAA